MANIANLAVQLSLNAGKFEVGLGAAVGSLERFGATAAGKLATIGRKTGAVLGYGANFAGLGKVAKYASLAAVGIEGFVKAASGIPIVGGFFAAIPLSVAGFLKVVQQSLDEMSDMTKQAQRLGISVETLATIQTLAGGSAEAMEKGMFRLSKTLGDAASGSKEAQATFGRLGMDGKALAALPVDQALAQIADRFAALKSPAERAYVAFELFGKTGFQIIPVLAKGSEGMRQAAQRAKELGLSFTDLEAGGAMRAKAALKQINLTMKGLQRQLAIEFAPVVGSLAEAFTKWVRQAGGLKSVFRSVAETVGRVMAVVVETLDAIIDKTQDLLRMAKNAPTHAGNAWNSLKLGMGMGGSFETPEAAPEGGAKKPGILAGLAKQLRDLPSWFDKAAKAARPLDAATLEAGRRAFELATAIDAEREKLQESVTAFGASASAVERAKLVKLGATAAQLKYVDALMHEIDVLERVTSTATGALDIFSDYRQKLDWLNRAYRDGAVSAEGYRAAAGKLSGELDKAAWAKAAAVFGETRNPLEKFSGKIAELNGLLSLGRLGWATYSRAVGAAANELIALKGAAEFKGAGLALAGSQEAHKAVVEAQGGGQQNAVELLKAAIDRQREQAARTAKDVNEIATAVRRGLFKVAPLP